MENEPIGENTYAAKMTTFEYPNAANFLIPKITSGSLYTGSFDMTPALSPTNDRLKCTSFGVEASRLISGKPLFFRGVYKYKSGDKYLDASENIQGMSLKARKTNVLFRLYCMKLRILMEKKLS